MDMFKKTNYNTNVAKTLICEQKIVDRVSALAVTVLAISVVGIVWHQASQIFAPHTYSSPSEWSLFAVMVSFYWLLFYDLTLLPLLVPMLFILSASLLGVIGSFGSKPKIRTAAAIMGGLGFLICLFDSILAVFMARYLRAGPTAGCIVVFIRLFLFGALVIRALQNLSPSYSAPRIRNSTLLQLSYGNKR